jgi:hypothetical protein
LLGCSDSVSASIGGVVNAKKPGHFAVAGLLFAISKRASSAFYQTISDLINSEILAG